MSEKRQDVLDILASVEGPTRLKPGCLGCAVYEQHGDDRAILYLEQWRSQNDLQRHIQSALYLRVLSAMELAREAPEIGFHEVSQTMGMELIEAMRAPELPLP